MYSKQYWHRLYVIKRRPIKLQLGEIYSIEYPNITKLGQLIKTTPKGYNLLDLKTSTVILKHHIYPSKVKCWEQKNDNETWFWINKVIKITNINNKNLT